MSDALTPEVEAFLAHAGVKGMKWGRRKAEDTASAATAALAVRTEAPRTAAAKQAAVLRNATAARTAAIRAGLDKGTPTRMPKAPPKVKREKTPEEQAASRRKAVKIGGATLAVGGVVALAILAKNGTIPVSALSKANAVRVAGSAASKAGGVAKKAAPKLIALQRSGQVTVARGKAVVNGTRTALAYKKRMDEILESFQETGMSQEELAREAGLGPVIDAQQRGNRNG